MPKIIGYFPIALQGPHVVKAPKNCAFLNVAEHSSGDNVVYAWFNQEHDESDLIHYHFYSAYTGQPLPDTINSVAQVVGTIVRKDGLVVHVFQLGKF